MEGYSRNFKTILMHSVCRNHNLVLYLFMTYCWVHNKSNTTDVTCGAGIAYPSGAPEFAFSF